MVPDSETEITENEFNEIINNSPNYCFIPFGTGNLYENVLNILKREVQNNNPDRLAVKLKIDKKLISKNSAKS